MLLFVFFRREDSEKSAIVFASVLIFIYLRR